jgi:hypothetical protein
MSGGSIADVVLAHIGHAEQWLRRARADYERGDLRQVVLRLLLAEAEIRRARESGTAIGDLPPRRTAQVPWGLLGTVVAAGLIVVGLTAVIQSRAPSPHAPGSVAQAPGLVQPGHGRDRLNVIVRFDTGQVLPFVGFPGRSSGTNSAPDAPVADVDRLLVTIGGDGPAFVTSR